MVSRAEEIYTQITGRKYILLLSFIGLVVLLFLVDVAVGPAWLSIREILSAIFKPGSVDTATNVIVWRLRLPIALMALVVGASLAIAGVQMQTILDNPLASPYTFGVAAAAGFGAALAIVLGVGVVPYLKEFIVPINAFFFAMLTCLLIYAIAKRARLSAEAMVLAGIAIMFLFQSLLSLLEYFASPEKLQAVVFWLFGSLQKTTWLKLGICSAILLVSIPALARDAWKLTALRLGDEKAKSLGINVERLRFRIFIWISILTATSVCFVGTIGFIGLIGPHVARMLVGEDQRFLLPASALVGGLLLSAASTASKLAIPGAIVPIGIVTSCVGGPFFLYLILRKRRDYW